MRGVFVFTYFGNVTLEVGFPDFLSKSAFHSLKILLNGLEGRLQRAAETAILKAHNRPLAKVIL